MRGRFGALVAIVALACAGGQERAADSSPHAAPDPRVDAEIAELQRDGGSRLEQLLPLKPGPIGAVRSIRFGMTEAEAKKAAPRLFEKPQTSGRPSFEPRFENGKLNKVVVPLSVEGRPSMKELCDQVEKRWGLAVDDLGTRHWQDPENRLGIACDVYTLTYYHAAPLRDVLGAVRAHADAIAKQRPTFKSPSVPWERIVKGLLEFVPAAVTVEPFEPHRDQKERGSYRFTLSTTTSLPFSTSLEMSVGSDSRLHMWQRTSYETDAEKALLLREVAAVFGKAEAGILADNPTYETKLILSDGAGTRWVEVQFSFLEKKAPP